MADLQELCYYCGGNAAPESQTCDPCGLDALMADDLYQQEAEQLCKECGHVFEKSTLDHNKGICYACISDELSEDEYLPESGPPQCSGCKCIMSPDDVFATCTRCFQLGEFAFSDTD